MRAKRAYLRYKVVSSFWFVPGIMLACAISLSFLTLWLDQFPVTQRLLAGGWGFSMGVEGARLMLSTIAGSMITVTSLVFSMTLVALTMASAQLGPRLLRTFMRDGVNQVVLGIFSATFIYALLILRTVSDTGVGAIVPVLSVSVAVVMSIASVALLIYFIHHVATSIQADTVIANVARELDATINDVFPTHAVAKEAARTDEELPPDFGNAARAVASISSGYIETIDFEDLIATTVQHDLVVRLERRPGHFVLESTDVALAWPADRVDDDVLLQLRSAVVLGPTRTAAQDVEFAVKALVEVALRALSPGINDEFTAVACIDRLGGALARTMQRVAPPPLQRDENGKLRLITNPTTIEGMFDAAFNQIRQASREHVAITTRLIETLLALAAFIRTDAHYSAVRKHKEMIERSCEKFTTEPVDRADIAERLQALNDALAAAKGRLGRLSTPRADGGDAKALCSDVSGASYRRVGADPPARG